jgi:2-octaprenyl-6-methoxyphenol hydroxylase
MTDKTDILIAGGGPSGLAAAAAFGAAGFDVICVDPTAPVTDEAAAGADIRTTAILQPGRALLERAGVWERLAPHATALQVMQIIDVGTDLPTKKAFDANDLGDAPFGWNLPNWLLRREFLTQINQMENVSFRPGVGFASYVPRSTEARVRLSDGASVSAKMVIAADGRASPVRTAAGIDVRTTRYGQKALAFAVTHPVPHKNISTEVHSSGGPFTLVPLPDLDGQPRSAVVWMERDAEAERLENLEETAFNAEATARSSGLLGPLRLASRRSVWPIISQIANRFDAPRVALMAEAAHVVPPIGAQGLNMSLADVRSLLELSETYKENLGIPAMLTRYHRARWPDAQARVIGIDALNRTSMAGHPVMKALRRKGVATLHDVAPLRKLAMRLGLGASG